MNTKPLLIIAAIAALAYYFQHQPAATPPAPQPDPPLVFTAAPGDHSTELLQHHAGW